MEWHWSYQSLPELAEFSRRERRRIWRQCCRETKSKRLLKIAQIANGLIPCALIGFYFFAIDRHMARPYLWFVYLLASFWISDLLTTSFMIKATLPRIRELVGNRCISCGYLLIGNISRKCPECGAEVDAVSSPETGSRNPPSDQTSAS